MELPNYEEKSIESPTRMTPYRRNLHDISGKSAIYVAQSAGAVEYTDCTSAEGLDPTNKCPVYDTK